MYQQLLNDWTTENGFEQLFKSLYTPLCRYALGIISDEMQAEEIVQDVFMILWQQDRMGNTPSNIQGYLYRAVHNKSLNFLKHEKVKEKYQKYVQTRPSNHNNSAEQQLETKELQLRIKNAMLKIPEKCRTVFHLCRQDELSYREIAKKLNISIKTVENQMSKALKILRLELKDYLVILIGFYFLSIFAI